MYNFDLQNLYMNSFLHYVNKIVKFDEDFDKYVITFIYFLDKRFVNFDNVDILEGALPHCDVIDLDEYYYKIISYNNSFNIFNIFQYLLQKKLIIDMITFSKVYEGG